MSKDFYVVTNFSVVQIFDFVPIIWKAGMIIAHEIMKS